MAIKPEAMLYLNYVNIAIPISQASNILPHLVRIDRDYDPDRKDYIYKLHDSPMDMVLVDVDKVTAMLVAHKMGNV